MAQFQGTAINEPPQSKEPLLTNYDNNDTGLAPKVNPSKLQVNYSLNDKDLTPPNNDNDDLSSDELIKTKLNQSFLDKYFGRKSMKGAVFNLIVAVVGAGILSFPFAFRASGLLFSLFLLILCTFFSYISLNLLIIASDYLPKHIQPSYLTLSLECGGKKLAYFTQLNVILSLLGSATSRIIGAGGIIVILYTDDKLFGGNKEEAHKYYVYFIIGFSWIIVFPLALMRNMSSLRFTSLLSVSCCIFLTICLFIEYFILCGDIVDKHDDDYIDYKTCFWKSNEIKHVFEQNDYSRLASFTFNGFLTSVPIFIFGYNCQPNVFPIYMELENKTSSKMQKVFKYALIISITLYIIAGSFAFLIFLSETCGNILLNDFKTSPEMVVACIIFTIAMILATPVFINAIRENINDMIWKKKQIPTIPHFCVTFGITLICVLISVVVSDIATVFGFIGCTTNPITGYILPTYFVWKLVPNEHTQHNLIKRIALIMIIIVSLISLGSIYYKIYVIVNDDSPTCGSVQDI